MPTRKTNPESEQVNSEAEPQEEAPVTTQADAPALPEIDETSPGSAADMTREVSEEEQKETDVVRYIGVFSERRISRADWEQAGVTDQGDVVWTKDNPTIWIGGFSDQALQLLSASEEFQIVRADDSESNSDAQVDDSSE